MARKKSYTVPFVLGPKARSESGPLGEEERAAVVACLSQGMKYTEAAIHLDISTARIRSERNRDVTFEDWCLDAIDYAEELKEAEIERNVLDVIENGAEKRYYDKDGNLTRSERQQKPNEALKMLQALNPKKYSDKQQVTAEIEARPLVLSPSDDQSREAMDVLARSGLLGPGAVPIESESVAGADPDEPLHPAEEPPRGGAGADAQAAGVPLGPEVSRGAPPD